MAVEPLAPTTDETCGRRQIRAVSEMQPKVFLFEHVKGHLRPTFGEYVNHIIRSLKQGGIERPAATRS